MPFYEREKELLNIIGQHESITSDELLRKLYISKSTLRRDLIKLESMGLIVRTHKGVMPVRKSADKQIPFLLRENEQNSAKALIAEKAAKLIKDGDTIMLDGTTSAYHIVPHLKNFKDIIVITSGAKASYLLGELGIKNICSGGVMINKSFSYVGSDALGTIARYNADIAFFSCRGLSADGLLSDNSVEENDVRKMIIKHSKRKVFLCNSEKIGNSYLHNLCSLSDIDDIICEKELPQNLAVKIGM